VDGQLGMQTFLKCCSIHYMTEKTYRNCFEKGVWFFCIKCWICRL